MEKTISMNDIIAFIHKAIAKGLPITSSSLWGDDITVNDNGIFIQINTTVQNSIEINTNNGGSYTTNDFSDLDISRFKVLVEEIKEYQKERAINTFNNFFKDEQKTIDDIDD